MYGACCRRIIGGGAAAAPSRQQRGWRRRWASSSSAAVAAAAAEEDDRAPPPRDARFNTLQPSDVAAFRRLLSSPSSVVRDEHDLLAYNGDWMGRYRGRSRLALRPRSTEQVSAVLAHCSQRRLAVVPQGGNTGLVGGSVPVHDEVVLSMGAMARVLEFDEDSGVVVCEAGCVLEALDGYLAGRGHRMPLDFGAKGSCQLGGNVATNAGGTRFLRYGPLRASLLGMEFVRADGGVVDVLGTLRKDNTGYDVKQLLVGSEGTLGVITKLAFAAPRRLPAVSVALLALPCFEQVKATLRAARAQLGEILSAFEFMDAQAFELGLAQLPGARDPFGDRHRCYVLLETVGSSHEHDQQKLESFLERAFEDGLLRDGVVAQDHAQMDAFWSLRESLPEALSRHAVGGSLKYDVSLPLASFYGLVEDTRARLDGLPTTTVSWGHVGDGNLHLNVSVGARSAMRDVRARLEPWVYAWVRERRGSISAEHGLGRMKADMIGYSKPPAAVEIMRAIKHALDPLGILNPYKVLPAADAPPPPA